MSDESELPEFSEPFDLGLYILDGHTPVHVTDTLEWGRWFEEHRAETIVKQEAIGPYWISTVFLGLDRNHARIFGKKGLPILFETMAFGKMGREDRLEVQERCSTWDQAEAQHARIAAEFQKAIAG